MDGHKRIFRTCKVKFGRGRQHNHLALITDFSDTGAFIKTSDVFDEGTMVSLIIYLDDMEFKLKGEVVWSSKGAWSLLRSEKHGIGVRFVDVSQEFKDYYREHAKEEGRLG